ncbi:hypothetical protein BD779DRAFT_1220364 [Infundibulicybe gibba]|nr:hypothetical protein BD779DRAFT_1220364 [Infundibulicybe gibba]
MWSLSDSQVAVFGVFSWEKTGSLAVTYTLDGFPTVNTYSVTPTTPEFTDGLLQHQNYLLFSNDSLSAGNHALVINVTQVNGLVFSMDYITYAPSFTSLDSKPDLTQPLPSPSPKYSTTDKRPSVGAIIGAVIGALVCLCAVFALFIIFRRRRRGNPPRNDYIAEPFILAHNQNTGRPSPTAKGANVLTLEPRGSADPSPVPNQRRKRRPERTDAPAPPPVPPPAPPAPDPPATEPAALTPRQLEIQRRMQELESLITMQGSAQDDDTDRQIAQLRARVDELLQENARLGGVPPPAYAPM